MCRGRPAPPALLGPSDEAAPADSLPVTSRATLSLSRPAGPLPHSDPQKLIGVGYFKLLGFGVICDTTAGR